MNVSISKSVGRGGVNTRADTREIQAALNAGFPATPIAVDGLCGRNTIRRIERFQRRFMQNPDGRVDPGGRTLRRLNGIVPARSDNWHGDSSRWPQAKKIASLDTRMRPKVRRVLAALKEAGFQPKIVYAWRSVDVQRRLVQQGRSKVSFSFHNAQQTDGTPNAYAADVIDRRWAWSDAAEENGFWAALGQAAKTEDMYWGGDWRSFKDWAHIQFFPNSELAEVKRESGLA